MQSRPARAASQSLSFLHGAMHIGSDSPQPEALDRRHSATAAFGQANGSVHGLVQTSQRHSSEPHSASVLHLSSQCVLLSISLCDTVLPQATAKTQDAVIIAALIQALRWARGIMGYLSFLVDS
jgi:hypothetical protein